MTCGIYLLRCTGNDVHYVGQSEHIERRWLKHKSLLRSEKALANRRLLRSARKHGVDSFQVSVLEVCSAADLTSAEQRWLDHFRGLGVPLANACGPVDAPSRGRVVSSETRAKISAAKAGRPMPSISGDLNPACRASFRLAMAGEGNPAKRADVRAKLSINNGSRRPVRDACSGEMWATMSECAAALRVSVAAVHAAVTKKNPTVAGRVLERSHVA